MTRARVRTGALLAAASLCLAAPWACGSGDDDAASGGTPVTDAGGSGDATTNDGAATDGGGGTDGQQLGDAPDGGGATYLYFGSTTILGFAWNAATGALTPIDMDPSTPAIDGAPSSANTFSVAAHGRYLYSGDPIAQTISAYAIDPATGRLTRIDAVTADGGARDLQLGQVVHILAHPTAPCLYAADQGSILRAFAIDDATGALSLARYVTTVGTSEVLAIDAQGKTLVVQGAESGGQIAVHGLDPVTGLPATIDGGNIHTINMAPEGRVSLHPSGASAYMAWEGPGAILAFAIDPATHLITTLPTVTDAGATGSGAVDPSGAFYFGSSKELYAVATNGALSASSALPSGPWGACSAVTFDPAGAHLVAACGGNGIVEADVSTTTGAITNERAVVAAAVRSQSYSFAWAHP